MGVSSLFYTNCNILNANYNKGFLHYSKKKAIKCMFEFKFVDLDNINVGTIWRGFLLLTILTGMFPKLVIKSFKKSYFKLNYIISLYVVFDSDLMNLFVINFKRIILNSGFCSTIINKQHYLNIYVENMSFVKYFDIRPEFYRWQEKIVFHVVFLNYTKLDCLLKNIMASFVKIYV